MNGSWTRQRIEMRPGFPDIYIYLVSTYKSRDARSYFKAGFVGKIMVTTTPMAVVVVCVDRFVQNL